MSTANLKLQNSRDIKKAATKIAKYGRFDRQLSAVLTNRARLYLALGWPELLMALSSFDEAQHR